MSKTLYHSELVKLSPVEILVNSDVLDSKYGGQPPYVNIALNGEERRYNLDSDQINDFFSGRKGQTFMITAAGFREDATVTTDGLVMETVEDDIPYPPSKPAARPASPRVTTPPPPRPASPARAAAPAPAAVKPAAPLSVIRGEKIVDTAGRIWLLAALSFADQLATLAQNEQTVWIVERYHEDSVAMNAAISTIAIQSDRMLVGSNLLSEVK